MVAWVIPALLGASAVAGGLLDDSDETAKEVARLSTSKKYRYPGQKKIATDLAPYLWENVDVGLTEKEKQLYRGAGRTSVLQALQSAGKTASSGAASQGLRGGSVANVLARLESQKIPAFAGIETGIMGADIKKKNTRIQDILAFLSLAMGEAEPGSGGGGATLPGQVSQYLGTGGQSLGVGDVGDHQFNWGDPSGDWPDDFFGGPEVSDDYGGDFSDITDDYDFG